MTATPPEPAASSPHRPIEPRQPVILTVETDPIPYGPFDSITDAFADTAIDYGITIGGHIRQLNPSPPGGAPEGTTAHLIEEWGRPGADHYIRHGTLGASGPMRLWRVQGTETIGDRAGSSCDFPAVHSIEAAHAQLKELRADPANARYDTWEIVRLESMVRTSLEPIDPPGADQ